jgi:AcrR family transcriptional regulator
MSRKSAEKKARQEYIISAARKLYEKKGVENVTMEDIAVAAEYTRRTLYSYFKNRDEISLLALVEDMRIRWEAQQKAIAKVKTGLEKIIVWGESFYEFARRNPHSMRLHLYWDFKGINPVTTCKEIFIVFEGLNQELADGLRAIFKLGKKDGSLRRDIDIDLVISQYLYSLRAIIHRAISKSYSFASFNPDKYVNYFLRLFSQGIAKNKGVKK